MQLILLIRTISIFRIGPQEDLKQAYNPDKDLKPLRIGVNVGFLILDPINTDYLIPDLNHRAIKFSCENTAGLTI